MTSSIPIAQGTDKTESQPNRPRYEPPVAMHVGNSHEGQGGTPSSCNPVGSGAVQGCLNGIQGPN